MLFMSRYVDNWFDGTKCKFINKKQLNMMVVFSPIFVADTKIIYGYNFVAPLKFALTFT